MGINSVGIGVEVGKGVMVGCRVIVGWAAGIFDSVFIDVCVGEISTALLVVVIYFPWKLRRYWKKEKKIFQGGKPEVKPR